MPKVKPEKIAGIVALSYLVLIPAAGVAVYLKARVIERDIDELWAKLGMPEEDKSIFSLKSL